MRLPFICTYASVPTSIPIKGEMMGAPYSRVGGVLCRSVSGPNLLIVSVLAAIIYGVSFLAYRLTSSIAPYKRLSAAFLLQLLMVASLYLFFK